MFVSYIGPVPDQEQDAQRQGWSGARSPRGLPDIDELDRVLERALAVAHAYVKQPRLEQLIGRLLSASDVLAARGITVPPRALPLQVLEAVDDPEEWFARYYDTLRLGVLEVLLHEELAEWQPLVDQMLAAFRRSEHAMVLCSGLAILESVMATAAGGARPGLAADTSPRRERALRGLAGRTLDLSETDWGSTHRHVLGWSLDAAVTRLRPSGDGGRHWTIEGRDSPSGWTREDAMKVLNALGTAATLLPQRLSRDAPARVSFGPTPARRQDPLL